MRTPSRTSSLLSLFLLGACTQPQAEATNPPDAPGSDELRVVATPTVAGEVGSAAGTPVKPGPGIERLVKRARQDLAALAGVDTDSIETVEAGYVTWRDSSLGCPAPGSESMQVLTPGARIRLRVDGKTYQYHSGPQRPPFLCRKPSAVEPLPYEPGEA